MQAISYSSARWYEKRNFTQMLRSVLAVCRSNISAAREKDAAQPMTTVAMVEEAAQDADSKLMLMKVHRIQMAVTEARLSQARGASAQ